MPNSFARCLPIGSLSAGVCQLVLQSLLWSNPALARERLDNESPSAPAPAPAPAVERGDGFNELFIMGQLKFVHRYDTNNTGPFARYCLNQADGNNCPLNAVALPNDRVNALLYQFQVNDKLKQLRDIIPLRVLEPVLGQYPFENDIAAVMKTYAERSQNVILAFSSPLPGWVEAETISLWNSQRAVQFAGFPEIRNLTEQRQKEYLKDHLLTRTIVNFVSRLKNTHGVSSTWLRASLAIEPLTEINTFYTPDPARAARIDSMVKTKLNGQSLPFLEVTSSSVITGSEWQYLDWFWRYYQAGGVGRPNIHLYYSAYTQNEAGQNVWLDGNDIENSYTRFTRVITQLSTHAHSNPNMRKIIVGEVGLSAAGIPGATDLATKRLESFRRINQALAGADQVVHWRLFKDFLQNGNDPIRCNDTNCGQLQAYESTLGYLSFFYGQLESDFQSEFAPSTFSWVPSPN